MRQGKSIDNRILRAKFSSITPQDIKRAMNKLVSPNELDAKAVDTRQELDLKIGCAFTRFQTRFFQGKYANLDSSVISFGPCQTPTLALCVKRHDDILSFQPDTFYTIFAKVRIDGNLVELDHTRDRIFVKKKATEIVESLKNVKSLL
jgi:DNA topoisomerase-3